MPEEIDVMLQNQIETGMPVAEALAPHLTKLAKMHDHLCPRQVLGVRMGMLAGRLFDLPLPQTNKRLLTLVETDGCFSDGVGVVTGCSMGHRTMRLVDYGKIAATFVDTKNSIAWRVAPHPEVRSRAAHYAQDGANRWQTMLFGYQRMPDDELFTWRQVDITFSIKEIVSKAGLRALCDRCREEIINEREVIVGNETLCRACAGDAYYAPIV